MKGPRSRHKFNVLRIWECPACKKREFAPARVGLVVAMIIYLVIVAQPSTKAFIYFQF